MMKKLLVAMAAGLLLLLLASISAFADEPQDLAVLTPSGPDFDLRPVSEVPPDSESIAYDDGHFARIYNYAGLWVRVRFTAPYDLMLRGISFAVSNPGQSTAPATLYLYNVTPDTGFGALITSALLPVPLVHCGGDSLHPVWNEFVLPVPVMLAAGEPFFVLLSSQSANGWRVCVDQNATTTRTRASMSGQFGFYGFLGNDALIRAEVTSRPAPPSCGYIVDVTPSNSPRLRHFVLHHVQGQIYRWVIRGLCPGTGGGVSGSASTFGWRAQ